MPKQPTREIEVTTTTQRIPGNAQVPPYEGPTFDVDVDDGLQDRSFLGWRAEHVAPEHVATLTLQPQIMCRPRRLVVDPEVAPHFAVTSVIIGQQAMFFNYLEADGGIPATLFPPLPTGLSAEERRLFEGLLAIRWPIVNYSQFVQIGVRNTSAEPRRFRGGIWADAVNEERRARLLAEKKHEGEGAELRERVRRLERILNLRTELRTEEG